MRGWSNWRGLSARLRADPDVVCATLQAVAEFIVTEAFGGPGEQGEARVFEAVKAAYAGEEALGFWRYPLVTRETVREPDILIADPEPGLTVIEVKSLPLDVIAGVVGYR